MNIRKKIQPFNTVKAALTAFTVAAAVGFAPASSAAVATYAQDFEALDIDNSFALGTAGGDGYQRYTSVWFGDVGTGAFQYEYFGSAPNGGAGFSAIATGEGGFYQGAQYLNIYGDYGNTDNENPGITINTSVFQESTIDASDIGSTWTLTFDAKSPFEGGITDRTLTGGTPQVSSTSATAFILTLDSSNNATNNLFLDMTSVSNTEWGQYTLSIALTDAALIGQKIQFGFNNTISSFDDSGVYYDNICFDNSGGCPGQPNPVPVPAAVWLFGSGLLGLVGVARRRKS